MAQGDSAAVVKVRQAMHDGRNRALGLALRASVLRREQQARLDELRAARAELAATVARLKALTCRR